MLSILKKGPSANKVPAEKIQATYGRYRMQALLSVFLGYLAYYIVRNNFTLSTPYLKEQLDLSATQIGLLSSCMLIAYGISKGVMSSLADKASPKVFMACGLVLCAIVNVGLGFSTAFWIFAALVVLNGLFQGWASAPLLSPSLTGSLAGSAVAWGLSGTFPITSAAGLSPRSSAPLCDSRYRALAERQLHCPGLRGGGVRHQRTGAG
jgi:MFS family permease